MERRIGLPQSPLRKQAIYRDVNFVKSEVSKLALQIFGQPVDDTTTIPWLDKIKTKRNVE